MNKRQRKKAMKKAEQFIVRCIHCNEQIGVAEDASVIIAECLKCRIEIYG